MDRVKLLPCQGEHYGYSPTQGDALGCVLMAFQAVSALGYHYFRNMNYIFTSFTLNSPDISFGRRVSRRVARRRDSCCKTRICSNKGFVLLLNFLIISFWGVNNFIPFIVFELTAVAIDDVLPRFPYLYCLRYKYKYSR